MSQTDPCANLTQLIREAECLAERLLSEAIKLTRERRRIERGSGKERIRYGLEISPAERRVIAQVRAGKTNREIAESLCVHVKTVKFHLTGIFRKLKIKSRAQLIVMALDEARGQAMGGEAEASHHERPQPLEQKVKGSDSTHAITLPIGRTVGASRGR